MMYGGAGAMKLIPEIAEKLDNLLLWEATITSCAPSVALCPEQGLCARLSI